METKTRKETFSYQMTWGPMFIRTLNIMALEYKENVNIISFYQKTFEDDLLPTFDKWSSFFSFPKTFVNSLKIGMLNGNITF